MINPFHRKRVLGATWLALLVSVAGTAIYLKYRHPAQIDASDALQTGGDGALTADQAALFDPNDPRTSAGNRLPAKLTTEEVHALLLDAECLIDYAKWHNRLFEDYNNLYELVANDDVKSRIVMRIHDRNGFASPDLARRWHDHVAAGPFVSWSETLSGKVDLRVSELRDHIIASQYIVGDVNCVKFLMAGYTKDIVRVADAIQHEKALASELAGEHLLATSDLPATAVDGIADINAAIQSVRQKHLNPDNSALASFSTPLNPTEGKKPRITPNTVYANDPVMEAARRNSPVRLTADAHEAMIRTLRNLATNLKPSLAFAAKTDQWTGPPGHRGPATLGAFTKLFKFRRNRFQVLSFELALSRFLSSSHSPAAQEISKLRTEVLNSDPSMPQARVDQIISLLDYMSTKDLASAVITVGEAEDIAFAAQDVEDCLDRHRAVEDQMDKLVDLLQSEPDFSNVLRPYIAWAQTPPPPPNKCYIYNHYSRDPFTPVLVPNGDYSPDNPLDLEP